LKESSTVFNGKMLCCKDFFWSVVGGLYRRRCAALALAGKRQGRAQNTQDFLDDCNRATGKPFSNMTYTKVEKENARKISRFPSFVRGVLRV
jgi:hypothetical protein